MQIIEAIERQAVAIPIKDMIGADGSFDFISEIKNKGYFDLDYRKDEIILVAGNFIGQIPLTDKLAIHVHPKFSIANLARMIGIANHPIRCLDFFRRKYTLEPVASESLLEAMARSLLVSLRELSVEGIYKEYKPVNRRLSSLQGRIDIPSFIRTSLPRAQCSVIQCNYYEFSSDTLFNRLIKRAIHTIGGLLVVQEKVDTSVIRELAYFADSFDSVTLDNSRDLVERVKLQLLKNHIPDLRRYYLDVLDVCCIIIDGNGIELRGNEGANTLHSLVVNLEDAFEQYIREVLRGRFLSENREIPILDGNTDGMSTLFFDGSTIPVKPDLIVGPKESAHVIGDVKYKTKLAENDRYQLISHSLSYGVKTAFVVSPALNRKDVGPVAVGSISRTDPIKIYHYRFDLESENIHEAESAFADWVFSLIGVVVPAN